MCNNVIYAENSPEALHIHEEGELREKFLLLAGLISIPVGRAHLWAFSTWAGCFSDAADRCVEEYSKQTTGAACPAGRLFPARLFL